MILGGNLPSGQLGANIGLLDNLNCKLIRIRDPPKYYTTHLEQHYRTGSATTKCIRTVLSLSIILQPSSFSRQDSSTTSLFSSPFMELFPGSSLGIGRIRSLSFELRLFFGLTTEVHSTNEAVK